MSWFSRLKNAVRPGRLDEDLAAELRDHVERRAAALRDQGWSAPDAYRQASTTFGNLTAIREQSREIRMWAALASILQDLRYAWRGMGRSPVFSATAILSLSLAIGAATAIYSIVDAAMLRPLPLPEPQQLFTLAAPALAQPGGDTAGERDTFSYPLYQDLQTVAGTSARLAFFAPPNRVEVQGTDLNGPVDMAIEQMVSGEAFEVLRVPPALGRMFSSEEDRGAGGHAVAILSYDYWQRRYHGDSSILDQAIRVDGRPFRVQGVAARGFFGIEPGKFVDVWVPATMFDPSALTQREFQWAHIAGRLTRGTTIEMLQSRLQPVFLKDQADRLRASPDLPPAVRQQLAAMMLRVHAGGVGVSGFRRTFARPLWIVFAVAASILLIACSSLASLLLARATSRSTEMAVRISLGAARGRLVRQLLTESLLLSTLAGIGGWILARMAGPALASLLSTAKEPVRFALDMDLRVLLFCAGVCTLCGLLFGLLPAWQGAAARPVSALRGKAGRLRMGRLLVSVQVAFAFCLVVAGMGFVFSLNHLFAVDTGFDAKGVTVFAMGARPRIEMAQLQQLESRIAALANVDGVAVGWSAIFEGARRSERVIAEGKTASEREEIFYRVSPGYFAALRTPLLSGRDFTFQDNDGSQPVPTIINRAFARRYFATDAVLGQEFRRTDGTRHVIVGLAANAHYGDLRHGPEPVAYFPMKPPVRFALYVRSSLDAGSLMRLVERETGEVRAGIHIVEATPLGTLVGNTILREKLLAGVGAAFAALGLLLAAIGLFGLLNYSVASRTNEIGIRAALGARRQELVLLVLKDLFGMIALGLVAGFAGSIAFLKLVHSLLYGVDSADPRVMGAATAVFLAAALIAGGVPARRAATVDPLVALRKE